MDRPTPSTSKTHSRAKSVAGRDQQPLKAFYFCSETLDSSIIDHQIKKTLTPLSSLKTVNDKEITNPYLFRGAPMVTTFIRKMSNRTRELRRFIEEACRADIRLAELGHSSLKTMSSFCSGRVPIYVHPCFYRSLKLRYPLDVGGICRHGRVTIELGTGSLPQAAGILTP